MADDAVEVCFRPVGIADFFCHYAVLDDHLATCEKLGEDENVGVCAEGYFAGVAVAEEDF